MVEHYTIQKGYAIFSCEAYLDASMSNQFCDTTSIFWLEWIIAEMSNVVEFVLTVKIYWHSGFLILTIIGRKVSGFFLYRSSSQIKKKLKNFLCNFKSNLGLLWNERPSFIVVSGDFRARCSRWWKTTWTTPWKVKLTVPQLVIVWTS